MYKIDSPISFDVNLEPYCEDCCMADLSIDETTCINLFNKSYKMRMIRCGKHDLCRIIYRHIKNEIEKGGENENQD